MLIHSVVKAASQNSSNINTLALSLPCYTFWLLIDCVWLPRSLCCWLHEQHFIVVVKIRRLSSRYTDSTLTRVSEGVWTCWCVCVCEWFTGLMEMWFIGLEQDQKQVCVQFTVHDVALQKNPESIKINFVFTSLTLLFVCFILTFVFYYSQLCLWHYRKLRAASRLWLKS